MGLNFNTTPVSVLGNGGDGLNQSEGSAAICSPEGVLLFYSDGNKIWNRFHHQLPNGYGLPSNTTSTQASLIVPVPGNPDLFYFFCADSGDYSEPPNDGITYSLVNLCENGGAGDLLPETKSTLLLKPATEKLASTFHSNGTDVWVMAHEGLNNAFYAWLITENGITGPVVSNVGEVHSDMENATIGYLKFSHDGTRLAGAVYGDHRVQLYDFDNTTGVVSNPIKFFTYLPYGLEFSPSNKVLYITSDVKHLYQFDLSVNTELAIKASEVLVHSNLPQSGLLLGGLQLGPDGIIYSSNLQRILEPENLGLACNFDANAGPLSIDNSGNQYFGYKGGLPNFNQSYFDPKPYIVASHSCGGEPVSFSLVNSNLVQSVSWDFGDPSTGINNTSVDPLPSHQFASGIYQVRAEMQLNDGNTLVKYKKIVVSDFDVDLGEDKTFCDVVSFQLDATIPADYVCYTWQDGSTAPTFLVTQTGTYWVDVRSKGCVKRDSIHVTMERTPKINIPTSHFLCENDTVVLSAKTSNANYLWSTGETSSEITVSLPGTYGVDIYRDICLTHYEIEVVGQALPVINLPSDITICEGEAAQLDVTQPNARYVWTSGSTDSSIEVGREGIYGVDVIINNCKSSHFVNVKEIKNLRQLNIDTLICEGTAIVLNVGQPVSQISWSTGSISPSIDVNEAGSYSATISNQCYSSIVQFHISTEDCNCDLFVPNVFTPDGEGHNDIFRPKTHHLVTDGAITIINRWGKEVFHSASLNNGWDGTDSGKEMETGVYFWMIQYGCGVGESRKLQTGYVQLIR